MIGGCQSILGPYCVPWSPLRVIMVTLLLSAAALTFHEWWLEVSRDA